MGNSSVPLYINLYNTYVEQVFKREAKKKKARRRELKRFFSFLIDGIMERVIGNGNWRMENEDNDTYIYYWTHTFARNSYS